MPKEKIKSGSLGYGMAQNAKNKLEGRQKQIDAAIEAAMGNVQYKDNTLKEDKKGSKKGKK